MLSGQDCEFVLKLNIYCLCTLSRVRNNLKASLTSDLCVSQDSEMPLSQNNSKSNFYPGAEDPTGLNRR